MVRDKGKKPIRLILVKGRAWYFFKYLPMFADEMIAAIGRLAKLLDNDPDTKFTFVDAAELQLKIKAFQLCEKSDTELLDDVLAVAVYNNDKCVVAAAREEIFRRMARCGRILIDPPDGKLIDEAIDLLERIEKADFDMPHQSLCLIKLGKQYAGAKELLLACMIEKT